MENELIQPAISPGEERSDVDKQINAESASCAEETKSNVKVLCNITSENDEHMVTEVVSESTENNCEMTETLIGNTDVVSADTGGDAVNTTSQNELKVTELQPENSGNICETAETTIRKTDVVSADTEVDAVSMSSQNEQKVTDLQPESSGDVCEVPQATGVECEYIIDVGDLDENAEDTDSESEGDSYSTANNDDEMESLDVVENMHTDPVYHKNTNSLSQLCGYGSDSESEEKSEKLKGNSEKQAEGNSGASSHSANRATNGELSSDLQEVYRKPVEVNSDTDSEDDSSEEESSSSSEMTTSSSDESEQEVVVRKKSAPQDKSKAGNDERNTRTKGELGLEDLPPIQDLCISVDDAQCVEIGHVVSIVESLVVVQAVRGGPALDLDTVLFLEKGKRALGQVFDVFGTVIEPCYCVRFNSNEHAREKGIEKGMPVYFAPRTEHANFVFVADLLKMKGSDASWENNNEPPEKFLEFSDDEEERNARRSKKAIKEEKVEPDPEKPPRPKKQAFRRNQQGRQLQQPESKGTHIANPYPGSPWASDSGFPFALSLPPPPPPPSPFQQGVQPLIRPPRFSTPPPFPRSSNADTSARSPRINPWIVPPVPNYSASPLEAHLASLPPPPPPPLDTYQPPPLNFPLAAINFPPPNANFASPDRNFNPSNVIFPPPQFTSVSPVSPNPRLPSFSQPPPGW